MIMILLCVLTLIKLSLNTTPLRFSLSQKKVVLIKLSLYNIFMFQVAI